MVHFLKSGIFLSFFSLSFKMFNSALGHQLVLKGYVYQDIVMVIPLEIIGLEYER